MSTVTVASTDKYRSLTGVNSLIGLSISAEPEPLLERGFGVEHLRELVLRLARPILRCGGHLAYAGNWELTDTNNFTYDLLRLIRSEQQDQAQAGSGDDPEIGRLRNHLAWPHYVKVTPAIEAEWVGSCRIIRVTQQLAGIRANAVVGDDEPEGSARRQLNSAIVLSQMRRLVVVGMLVPVPGRNKPYEVRKLDARIMLGGKTRDFSGFLPGLFEEALVTLERRVPFYLLGGFGGAAGVLARALLERKMPEELELAWQKKTTPRLKTLSDASRSRALPAGVRTTASGLSALRKRLVAARGSLHKALQTHLSEAETRELLTTCEMGRALQLVFKGLERSARITIKRT